MDIEALRAICMAMPGATEEIQWEDHLLFKVGGKMFCIGSLDGSNIASFKVPDESFEELVTVYGYKPASHLARAKWVQADGNIIQNPQIWKERLNTSYLLVRSKLPKKVLASLG
jgi:predicted DNA-binding protein (MmcQ/YjbR family)